jgi:hypothetical protein
MKKLTITILIFFQLSLIYSQQCTKVFSTKVPNSYNWIIMNDSLLSCIYGPGFTLLDCTTGNIIFEKTYPQMGGNFINTTHLYNPKTGNYIVSDNKSSISLINLKSGNVVWELKDFKNIIQLLNFDEYILVFDKDKPFFPITCLDAENGSVIWKNDNKNEALSPEMFDSLYEASLFIIDHMPNKKFESNNYSHPISFLSSKTGESAFSIDFICQKIETNYTHGNCVYFITIDTQGTKLTKVDLFQKGKVWEHYMQIPFFFKFIFPFKRGMYFDINISEEKVFIKSELGFEVLNDNTGEQIFINKPLDKSGDKTSLSAQNSHSIVDKQFAYITCAYTDKPGFYFSKFDFSNYNEIWSNYLGEYYLKLNHIYKTDFGILMQYGGVFRDLTYYSPYSKESYKLEMIDINTGKTIWTITDDIQKLYSTNIDDQKYIYLFTDKLIKKIDLATGVEIYNTKFDAINYVTSYTNTDQVVANNLDNFLIDIKRKMIILFGDPYNHNVSVYVEGYKFK